MAVDAEHIMSLAKNAKLHRELCMKVVIVIHKVLKIFPQVEAQKPRCNIGLQNLSATHIALDKAKLLIEQCADCSKLYLAVTGEAVLGKFERIKNSLAQSLRTLESMIPQKLGKQIAEIVKDLQTTKLELKPSEKEISNELIILLQRYSRDKVDPLQLEVFQQAAVKLGLQSKTAVLTERRALNRLAIEASEKEDEKKEAIINYFLELLSLHAKFRYDNVEDDTRSQASSMTEGHSGGNISLLPESSFSPRGINSPSRMLPTPSEFKCPISLQLMFDPVVIASGQTYERSCIEKWFKEGHDTCPKTQQSLPHLNVTPNYCIKGLIASWCEKNGIKFRNSAAQSHTWHHSMCMADLESMTDQVDNSVREIEGGLSEGEDASNLKAEGNNVVSGDLGSRMNSYPKKVDDDSDWTENCDSKTDLTSCFKELEKNDYSELDQLLTKLAAPLLESQLEAVEKIKVLAENTKTCFYIGECGMIPPLVNLLQSVIDASDLEAQQVVALALRNISKNDRNKEIMSSAGALPLLLNLIRSGLAEEATLVLLELSILDNEKHAFVSCEAIPLLFELLESENSQCAQHALGILCNLSTIIGQWTNILSDMEMEILVTLLSDDETRPKVIKIINHLAGLEAGRALIAETEGCILAIVESLDTEELEEQDHGLDTVFLLCTNSDDHSQLVLREGVIPALVNISVNGSVYGKDKAQKLLELFREQRTRELSWTLDQSSCDKEVSFNHHLGHAETREEIVARSPRRGTKRRSVVSSLRSFCCSCNKNP